jgi:hypothetical protein
MTPYSGIGVGKVSIIDLQYGVVVQGTYVRYLSTDYGYECIVSDQSRFRDQFGILYIKIQGTPITSVEKGLDQPTPILAILISAGLVAMVGTKVDVLCFFVTQGEIGIIQQGLYPIYGLQTYHEQSLLSPDRRMFYFAPQEETF